VPGSCNAGSWSHNRSVGAPSDVDIDGRSLQIERAITWGLARGTARRRGQLRGADAGALAGAGVKTAWAGLYESTPDHQAILGPVAEVEGFWCAAGFSGHGFMQAPATSLLLTQLLLDKKSEIDISSFAFERFARGALVTERNII